VLLCKHQYGLQILWCFFVVSLSLVVRIDAGFGSAAAFFSGSWWKKGFVGICALRVRSLP